jgi:hypothetical protein
MLTLAEDLLLLLLDDATGKPRVDSTSLDYGLAGAVLAELEVAGRIEVVEGEGFFGRDHVRVVDAAPTGDESHDAALRLADEKPRRGDQLVPRVSKGLRPLILRRLEQRGIVSRESTRVFGIFGRDRWPAQDASAEQALRQRLHDVLVLGTTPDARTVSLIALLSAIDQAHKILDIDRVERKAVKTRAKSLAEGSWTATAVRQAVRSSRASSSAGASATIAAASVTT